MMWNKVLFFIDLSMKQEAAFLSESEPLK